MDTAARVMGSPALQQEDQKAFRRYAGLGAEHSCADDNTASVTVEYSNNGRLGRLYPNTKGATCYNKMNSGLRGLLANPLYHDVDITNCIPTVASQLMAKLGIACPQLTSYNDERDAWLQVCLCLGGY